MKKGQLDNELCSLKEILKYSDVELDELKCCKDELEMTIASLQSKLNSQTAELMQLQEQHFGLKNRLLEQEWRSLEEELGTVVHRYSSNNFSCFGELALMYNKALQASIRAVTDGYLWALKR